MRIQVMNQGFALTFPNQEDLDTMISNLMSLRAHHSKPGNEYPAILLTYNSEKLGGAATQILINAIMAAEKVFQVVLTAHRKVESQLPAPIMCTAHPEKPAVGFHVFKPLEPADLDRHDVFVCPDCKEKAQAEGHEVKGILEKLRERARAAIPVGAKKISTLIQVVDKDGNHNGPILKIETIKGGKVHTLDPNGAKGVVAPESVIIVGEEVRVEGENKPPLITMYKEPIKPDVERWKKAEENLAKGKPAIEKTAEKPQAAKVQEDEKKDILSELKPGDIVKQALDRVLGKEVSTPSMRVERIEDDKIHAVYIEGPLKGTEEVFIRSALVLHGKKQPPVEMESKED